MIWPDVAGMALDQAAPAYAEHDWRVFPCAPRGKRPITTHGFRDATTDADQICAWWARHPDANIGIAIPEGFFVWDVDGPSGKATMRELAAEHGEPPKTAMTKTGRGWHLWFRGAVRSGAAWLPGIDTRGPGGYVIAPPSRHENGTTYKTSRAGEILDAPAWMTAIVTPQEQAPINRGPVRPPKDCSAWARGARDGVIAELASASKGQRNHALNSAAYRMGRLVVGGMLGRDDCEQALLATALSIGLGNREATRTIASGLDGGMKHPHPGPDDFVATPERSTMAKADAQTASAPQAYALTELGNAERFARDHGKNVRYLSSRKRWLIWNGRRWRPDNNGSIYRLAKKTVRGIYAEAKREIQKTHRENIASHARRSETRARLDAMLTLAESDELIAITEKQLDCDLFSFNTQNGTLNLRTGKLRPHNRGDLITKISPARYDADATAPQWQKFLTEILPSEGLRIFVQRAIGYSLTGDTREHLFFVFWGSGANGKSTLLETVRQLLGNYARNAESSTFLARGSNDNVRNDLAMLDGARLVSISETEGGRRLDESTVKNFTGGDTVTARFLYGEFFEFTPRFKAFLSTNHRPEVRDQSEGIWRRLRLIPFAVTIAADKRDKELGGKLRAELPGILRWAVDGCLTWQRENDLTLPKEVSAATDAYREHTDPLADWLRECCILGPGRQVVTRDLFASFRDWQLREDPTGKPMGKAWFGRRLSGRSGLSPVYFDRKKGWAGISLRPNSGSATACNGKQPNSGNSHSDPSHVDFPENTKMPLHAVAADDVIPAEEWRPWWSAPAIEAAFDARTEIVPLPTLPGDTSVPPPAGGYTGRQPKYPNGERGAA